MVKVVAYIETLGTEKFKNFLNTQFNYNMLNNVFENWSLVSNSNNEFINNDKIIIKFGKTHYTLKMSDVEYELPFPHTVNDFINDVLRFNVSLYWSDWIEEKFEPKDFLPQSEIVNYYKNLLRALDKEHELITEAKK